MAPLTGVSSSLIDSLYPVTSPQSTQLESYAQNSLVKGLQLFSDGKYEKAIAVFKKAVGYAPSSTAAINAYDYMAKSYLKLGDNRSAISTYKKSIVASSSNDAAYTSLGNIYYSQKDYANAVKSYEQAAKFNPSSVNLYSLGQGYMANGQYSNAMRSFNQVRQMAPDQPYGNFGMGQVYAKQGQYSEAIASFQKAIKIDPKDWNAYSEMGFAYVDNGQTDQAKQLLSTLQSNSPSLASQLSTYISSKTKPKMVDSFYQQMDSPFLTILRPGTQVGNLGNFNLLNPDASATFTISFQFNKQMDQASVENVQNWSMTRATSNLMSESYNYSQPLPSTEVMLPYNPSGVVYDPKAMTATLFFQVTQNSSGNGTIDPSHIQFSFNGKDANGLTMDPKADQYTGFSGFA
jgi:tetratricopeptide (TPR) repeat protein